MKQWAEVTDLVVLEPQRPRQHGNAAVLIHPNEHNSTARLNTNSLACQSLYLPHPFNNLLFKWLILQQNAYSLRKAATKFSILNRN